MKDDLIERLRGDVEGLELSVLNASFGGEGICVGVKRPDLLLSDLREAADALERLQADHDAVRREAWQPIETASKDEGVSVLLGWTEPGYPVVMGFWSGDYHGLHKWCDEHYENDFAVQPTHWQPLPAPPGRSALASEDGGVRDG